jgi:predicted GNAT family N-acyltransferase
MLKRNIQALLLVKHRAGASISLQSLLMDTGSIEFVQTALEEILPLRDDVLIRGTGRTSPEFPGDHDPTTMHFAARLDGMVVGCATMMLNTWDGSPAWQLRGMATHADRRSSGIGGQLLGYIERELQKDGTCMLQWCNARVRAIRFYEQNGWVVVSEEFAVEGVGPHVKMLKRLPGTAEK